MLFLDWRTDSSQPMQSQVKSPWFIFVFVFLINSKMCLKGEKKLESPKKGLKRIIDRGLIPPDVMASETIEIETMWWY